MWLIGIVFGFFTCWFFDISMWWVLIPLIIGFAIDFIIEDYRREQDEWNRMSEDERKKYKRNIKLDELLK